MLVFEGWDAAGKGGVIRRITGALDARDYQRRTDRGAHATRSTRTITCGASGGACRAPGGS